MGTKEITIATDGLVLEDYLVHLHHTVCESLITGVGEDFAIRHVPHIDKLPDNPGYVRVVPDPQDPARVKAAAYVA